MIPASSPEWPFDVDSVQAATLVLVASEDNCAKSAVAMYNLAGVAAGTLVEPRESCMEHEMPSAAQKLTSKR